jgi:hypothetical protein
MKPEIRLSDSAVKASKSTQRLPHDNSRLDWVDSHSVSLKATNHNSRSLSTTQS